MFRSNRIGFLIVLASLVAIAVIAYMVINHRYNERLVEMRTQGMSLARVLSGVTYEQLTRGGAHQSILQVLRYRARDDDLAYASIVDLDGRIVNEIVSDGLVVQNAPLPSEPASWLGERSLTVGPDERKIIEFHAPLLTDSELQGFVRLGFQRPTIDVGVDQVPFLAAVSLPVFLLVPLFYLLLRLEIRPIQTANQEIGRLIEGDSFRRLEIAATGELGDFMQRFNRFVELANVRIAELEKDQHRLVTSSKLLTYRKNRIETVLETLPEAVLILDETGTINFANQKLAALFGVSQQAILAQPPAHWCDHPDILHLLAKYQAGGKARTFTDTIRFNLDSLMDRSIATRTYPLFSPKNSAESIGTLIVFRDETQEALARQARADFVAHLSHELKSPLNVLSLYSESLLGEAGRTEEFRIEAANIISEEVDRLTLLVSGLLNMTQIENGSLTPDKNLVKLRDVATAAFEEAKGLAAGKDYEFRFDAPKEMNPVYVDKDLIRIAITNLLSNAVKYNREGGEVRLTIEETEDAIQLRVADSGIGISEQEAAKIFDKFYRSEDDRVQAIGGHGLGLALAKQIIELHHGTLSLNHDREEGAEFIINLWKEATAIKQAI